MISCIVSRDLERPWKLRRALFPSTQGQPCAGSLSHRDRGSCYANCQVPPHSHQYGDAENKDLANVLSSRCVVPRRRQSLQECKPSRALGTHHLEVPTYLGTLSSSAIIRQNTAQKCWEFACTTLRKSRSASEAAQFIRILSRKNHSGCAAHTKLCRKTAVQSDGTSSNDTYVQWAERCKVGVAGLVRIPAMAVTVLTSRCSCE